MKHVARVWEARAATGSAGILVIILPYEPPTARCCNTYLWWMLRFFVTQHLSRAYTSAYLMPCLAGILISHQVTSIADGARSCALPCVCAHHTLYSSFSVMHLCDWGGLPEGVFKAGLYSRKVLTFARGVATLQWCVHCHFSFATLLLPFTFKTRLPLLNPSSSG